MGSRSGLVLNGGFGAPRLCLVMGKKTSRNQNVQLARGNQSLNRSWLAFRFSNLFSSLCSFVYHRPQVLVPQPGELYVLGGIKMGRKVERKCQVCGLRYSADEVRLKHGRQPTCSRECSYKLRAISLSKSKAYKCAVCGEEVLRSPAQVKSRFVFCSRECHTG